MNTKISNAQIEVWQWKETLYQELCKVPKWEQLKYINEKVKDTINTGLTQTLRLCVFARQLSHAKTQRREENAEYRYELFFLRKS